MRTDRPQPHNPQHHRLVVGGLALAAVATAMTTPAPAHAAPALSCTPTGPQVQCSMLFARQIPAMTVLRPGSRGAAVTALQRALWSVGQKSVSVTGSFDAATTGALRNYQATRKLPPTGTLDSRTLRFLVAGAGVYAPTTAYLPRPTPAPGTSVTWAVSQQVMVATHTSGTTGRWVRYEWKGSTLGWVRVSASGVVSVFGKAGVRAGSQRVMGDMTTPTGAYPIEYTFGKANPGSRMPYRVITSCSWWSDVPGRTYNRWVESCAKRSGGEHLIDYKYLQYQQAAVIGFNYRQQKSSGHGSGTGIFLHYGRQYTEGCVGLRSVAELTATIAWLDSSKHPYIVIR